MGRLSIAVFTIAASFVHPSLAVVAPPISIEGAGVSRALAVSRVQRVSNLHYILKLTLRPHAADMPGHEEILFTLAAPGGNSDLPLDYREGTIRYASLNDRAI